MEYTIEDYKRTSGNIFSTSDGNKYVHSKHMDKYMLNALISNRLPRHEHVEQGNKSNHCPEESQITVLRFTRLMFINLKRNANLLPNILKQI